VVERKNRLVQEIARTMLTKSNIADKFWKEVVHTMVYIQNKCMLRPHENKTPYELWFGKKASTRYFKVLGVSATSRGQKKILASSMIERMKVYFLVTQ